MKVLNIFLPLSTLLHVAVAAPMLGRSTGLASSPTTVTTTDKASTQLERRSKCASARWIWFYFGLACCIQEAVEKAQEKKKKKKAGEKKAKEQTQEEVVTTMEVVTTTEVVTTEVVTNEETAEVVYDKEGILPVGVRFARSDSIVPIEIEKPGLEQSKRNRGSIILVEMQH